MKKVRTMQEAYRIFELLGMKEVTKPFQKRKGTEVWELPQKTMYYNGHGAVNRFTIYKNGYVRKMVVYGENNASKGCWQLNLVRKVPKFVKDYKWCDERNDSFWTGKYRKIYNNERIMIDNHRDRVIYLCNYILKNYYRKMDFVGNYTIKRMKMIHDEWWRNERKIDTLPFYDGDEHDLALEHFKKIPKESFTSVDDIKVIINGQRYNLV
tara:strand:+ start:159 stop:788 length:630 start_codon:yes stop_codon:yes gene_type:complete